MADMTRPAGDDPGDASRLATSRTAQRTEKAAREAASRSAKDVGGVAPAISASSAASTLPGARPAGRSPAEELRGAEEGGARGPRAGWAVRSQLRQALWLAPPLFLIHNAEEAIAMARWASRELPGLLTGVRAALPLDRLPPAALGLLPFLRPPTAVGFVWAAALATLLPALVYWPAALRGPRSRFTRLAVWSQAVVLLNVFVPHLALTLALGRYTPGVITAVLLNLPLSWMLLRSAVREGVVTRRALVAFGATALASYGFLVAALLALGRVAAAVLGG